MELIFMIERNYYLQKLIDYKDKDIIKIITGIRRCGKSFLLSHIYYDYIIKEGISDENIIKLHLESIRYEKLRQPELLFEYIDNKIQSNKKYYIFIDEIQLMNNFEDVVNGIKSDFNCDIYITGSNSKLLSSEINTKFRGRGLEIKVYPFSFKEYYNGY